MDEIISRGIIIKQSAYGDAHRMLSLFTADSGIIKAVRYGIKGKKTSNAASFQFLCYGDFRLRPSGGGIMTAVSADITDGFYPISEDIQKLALMSYLADITYRILGEGNPDTRILRLFLNTAHAAAYRSEPIMKLKAVYEFKAMCAGGYMPDLSACVECGGSGEYFSLEKGVLVCSAHRKGNDVRLDGNILAAMRYLRTCDDRKMLSFSMSDEKYYSMLGDISEKYVSLHCDKEFKSLSYFKSML